MNRLQCVHVWVGVGSLGFFTIMLVCIKACMLQYERKKLRHDKQNACNHASQVLSYTCRPLQVRLHLSVLQLVHGRLQMGQIRTDLGAPQFWWMSPSRHTGGHDLTMSHISFFGFSASSCSFYFIDASASTFQHSLYIPLLRYQASITHFALSYIQTDT